MGADGNGRIGPTMLLTTGESGIEEGARLRTDSTRTRGDGRERGLNFEAQSLPRRLRNLEGEKKAFYNNMLIWSTTCVSRICYRPFDAVPCRDIASSTGTSQRALALGLVRLHLSSATPRLPPERVDNSSSGDRAALAADGEADRSAKRSADRRMNIGQDIVFPVSLSFQISAIVVIEAGR